MPRRIEHARIALMNVPFQIESTETKSMITIRDASMVKKFIEEEAAIFKSMAESVKRSGANVVICQKAMDDVAKHFLARHGILGVEKAYEYEMPRISRAMGARVVTNFEDLRESDLGYADLVEERLVGADRMLFVEGCRNPKAVTILLRGGSQRVIEEAERSVHDALMVTKDVLERPYLLAGGGAPEAEASFRVREWAKSLEGREQLAAEKYADALEQIPLALAENAGMDTIDTAVELRARHAEGGLWYGVDALHGKVRDMHRQRVFEPLAVKRQVISSATEAASMLLRIDDIITMVPTIPPRSGGPQMGPAPEPGV
jgi:chaperonin GroEL (HSP60 family)